MIHRTTTVTCDSCGTDHTSESTPGNPFPSGWTGLAFHPAGPDAAYDSQGWRRSHLCPSCARILFPISTTKPTNLHLMQELANVGEASRARTQAAG